MANEVKTAGQEVAPGSTTHNLQTSVMLECIAGLASQLNELGADTVDASANNDGDQVARLGVSIRDLAALVGYYADHTLRLIGAHPTRRDAGDWLLPPVCRRPHVDPPLRAIAGAGHE